MTTTKKPSIIENEEIYEHMIDTAGRGCCNYCTMPWHGGKCTCVNTHQVAVENALKLAQSLEKKGYDINTKRVRISRRKRLWNLHEDLVKALQKVAWHSAEEPELFQLTQKRLRAVEKELGKTDEVCCLRNAIPIKQEHVHISTGVNIDTQFALGENGDVLRSLEVLVAATKKSFIKFTVRAFPTKKRLSMEEHVFTVEKANWEARGDVLKAASDFLDGLCPLRTTLKRWNELKTESK